MIVLAWTLAPASAGLDDREMGEFLSMIDEELGRRPPALRRQLMLFLSVLRWLPALRFGKPLDRLGQDQRIRSLRWFEAGPIGVFRKGFWGVKALVFMGWYGRPEAASSLGYTPVTDGNAVLRQS